MNRSFVLVAVLGFCSLALSAPTSPDLAQRDVAAAFSGSPATPINAPEIPPAIESLRAGLSVFRRQINPTITTIPANATNATTVSTTAASGAIATQVTVINDVKPAEVQENGGAPVIDPIISGLRSGKTTFRRASSGGDNKPSGVGGVISDIVKPLEAFNPFGGAPSMNRVAQNQRTDYSKGGHFRKRNSGEEAGVPRDLSGPCSRWNAVNCRRQETANTVNKNFAGAPEFDPILEGLHAGTTVFNNGADLPKDSPLLPREPFMAQSNGAYDGAPNTDSTVEAMREGNDRFGRRQATNFAGAPEFDPILEGLRNGASVFNPSKPVPPHRREASPMGSMGSGAPSFNLGFGNFHFRRDGSSDETESEEELDARNFGGQAIPVGGNAEALKAMWTA